MNEESLQKFFETGCLECFEKFVRFSDDWIGQNVSRWVTGPRLNNSLDDIKQDVYIKVLRSFLNGSGWNPERARASTWLSVIIRRVAIDHFRRGIGRALPLPTVSLDDNPPDWNLPSPVTESLTNSAETTDTISWILQQFPERDIEIVRATKLLGKTYREVAEKMGISITTVHNVVRAFLSKARNLLGDAD